MVGAGGQEHHSGDAMAPAPETFTRTHELPNPRIRELESKAGHGECYKAHG